MFLKAIPVWGDYIGAAEKQNRHLIFTEEMPSLKGVVLNIAAADFYRLTVNGEFVAFGPARTAKGYARVDSYDLSTVKENPMGRNEIVIEVAGYCCKSLSTVLQDSFLCAELLVDGKVEKYTGKDFFCRENMRRVRNVERYSVQRHFGEIYTDMDRTECPVIQMVPLWGEIRFISRGVPAASCRVTDISQYISRGEFRETPDGRTSSGEYGTGRKQNAYSFPPEREDGYGAFLPEEIPDKPYRYIGGLEKQKTSDCGQLPVTVSAGQWVMVDFETIQCGFMRFSALVSEDCDLILAFSELCEGENFGFRRINLQGVLEYKLTAGKTAAEESFEPYTFRHVAVFVKSGSLVLKSVGVRSYERDTQQAIHREFRKPSHNEIYKAALRTFAHNAVDLFTDCPSRERAGWLCDSFFTGRAEYFLYGKTPIEDAFLENYRLYQPDGSYPQGALPMCYPSTPSEDRKFIPQWNIWYVLEVCEYLEQRRPDLDNELFRPTVMGIVDFLAQYENTDGLLEDLPSWNFVEWSDANTWTQNVNYPTNFLYGAMLEAVSETFDYPQLQEKAAVLREKTASRSFNGEVFVDHAVRQKDGTLENQKHISEACQYYAILFGGVDLENARYQKLKELVVSDFRDFAPEGYAFCPKNAFIGLYLRMNVLINMRDSRLLAETVESFCLYMSRTTGTLWEYKDGKGSLDHGFASYIALALPIADA